MTHARLAHGLLALVLASLPACSEEPSTIGVEGGTVASSDGKMQLVIPAGALAAPAQFSLTKQDGGYVAIPNLVADSTYALAGPSVPLAAPAQLIYALGNPPALSPTSIAGIGSQHAAVMGGACIMLSGTICQVELGTGPCPSTFPTFTGLQNIPWSDVSDPLNPIFSKWVLDCQGPPYLPVPALTTLGANPLNLGGLFTPANGQLSASLSALAPGIYGALLDLPTLDVTINKAQIHPTDSFIISAVEVGSTPVAKIEFYDNGGTATDGTGNANNGMSVTAHAKVGEATALPYSAMVSVSGLSLGKRIFEARALDANGGLITNSMAFVDIVPAGALALSLSASATTVTAAGSVTLTASPSGGGAVKSVELFEGTTSLGKKTTGPYQFDVAYASANNGAHTYHALVTDAAQATAVSNDVNVIVNIAVVGPSYYVDPVAGNDANVCSMAAPCKTIGKASTGAVVGTTIVLANGTYAAATQGAAVSLPDGVTLKASTPGMATVTGVAITFTGSGGLDGLVADTGATFTAASTTGTPLLTMTGVLWKTMGALSLGGNLHATLTPGTLAGGIYTASLAGGAPLFSLAGTSQLLIAGGILDGNNAGTANDVLIVLGGSSHLTLDNATIRNRPTDVIVANGSSVANHAGVTLQNGAVLDNIGGATGGSAGAEALFFGANVDVVLDNAQIKNCTTVAAIGTNNFDAPNSSLTIKGGSVLSHNRHGFNGGNGGGPLTVTVNNATFSNQDDVSGSRAIRYNGTGTFDLTAVTFTANHFDLDITNLQNLKVRNSTFSSTINAQRVTLSEVPGDFGTSVSPGGNTFTNTMSTGLQAFTQGAGIVVNAVGNTWNANQQGADAMGKYPAGTQKVGMQSGANFALIGTVTLNL